MIFLSVPLCILFFMLGGQINKLFRPIGVTLTLTGLYIVWHNHSVWFVLPSLWYGFTLTLGYGENSKLMKWLKSEQVVRIILGISSALPVLIVIIFLRKWWVLFGIPFIVGVECIRLGKWASIGKFDILPVDIFRGLVVSVAMSIALL